MKICCLPLSSELIFLYSKIVKTSYFTNMYVHCFLIFLRIISMAFITILCKNQNFLLSQYQLLCLMTILFVFNFSFIMWLYVCLLKQIKYYEMHTLRPRHINKMFGLSSLIICTHIRTRDLIT